MVHLSREAVAHEEIGKTNVTPAVARGVVVLFLLFVASIAIFEAKGPWERLGGIPAAAQSAEGIFGKNRAVLEGLHGFETALEDESRTGRLLRPPIQGFVSGMLGAGNEQVYVGRERWLFYRPDVEYVTMRGFMAEDVRERRIRTADEWTIPPRPDPRQAILAFKRELDARGIAFIIVPTPVKPMVHPEMLSASFTAGDAAIRNPDHLRLLDELRSSGVTVFDPTDPLVEAARITRSSQYLSTDTHWRPEAMELVAEHLGRLVAEKLGTAPGGAALRVESIEVTQLGDTFAMLNLPRDQNLYPAETVSVRRVLSDDGSPWRSSPDAEVLLLGDSFTNIYSLESMGWGTSGGLAEHLALALRRPVDRIVQNDAGAYATREILARAGDERIRNKKVVIWQFAAREFAFGDWKVW